MLSLFSFCYIGSFIPKPMEQLISKLQYKNDEKGEFTSEEARSLEDTIKLITDFPWAAERHITAVELTGGSVTIQDVDSNYLKVSYDRLDKFRLYVCMVKAKSFQYKMLEMDDVQKIVKSLTMQKVHKYKLINKTRQLGAEERDVALEKLNTTLSTKQSIQDLFTGTYGETKMAPKELCELYGDLQLSKRIGRTSGTHGHIQIASTIGMQMVSHGSYGDKYYGKKTMSDIKQKINFILHQALYPN